MSHRSFLTSACLLIFCSGCGYEEYMEQMKGTVDYEKNIADLEARLPLPVIGSRCTIRLPAGTQVARADTLPKGLALLAHSDPGGPNEFRVVIIDKKLNAPGWIKSDIEENVFEPEFLKLWMGPTREPPSLHNFDVLEIEKYGVINTAKCEQKLPIEEGKEPQEKEWQFYFIYSLETENRVRMIVAVGGDKQVIESNKALFEKMLSTFSISSFNNLLGG